MKWCTSTTRRGISPEWDYYYDSDFGGTVDDFGYNIADEGVKRVKHGKISIRQPRNGLLGTWVGKNIHL